MVLLRNRLVLVGLALVILVGIAGVAAAAPAAEDASGFGRAWRSIGKGGFGGFCGAGKGGAGPQGQGSANMIEQLNLTDDQIAQIRKINADTFQKTQELQNLMSQKMFELRDLCWQKEPDESAIAAKRDEITALRKQMAEINQKKQADLDNVLTSEQKDTLSKLRGTRRGKGGGRRGAGGFIKTPAPGDAGTTSN